MTLGVWRRLIQMAYELYVNVPQKTITLHVDTCGQLRKMGGFSTIYPPTGFYVNGLTSRGQAAWAARYLAKKVGLKYHTGCACL